MHLRRAAFVALTVLVTSAGSARAQDDPLEFDPSYISAGVTAGAFTASYLVGKLDIDTSDRWKAEIFGPVDESVKTNFSPIAAMISDGGLYTLILSPFAISFRNGFDEQGARRALVAIEALALNTLGSAASKMLVKRPRPYNYNPDPRVASFAATAGPSSHKSFYSGHASTAFTSAMVGSYIYAAGTEREGRKAISWGLQFGLASMTAALRVRAGKHYYSDVIIGGLIGSAIGFLIPTLHWTESGVYQPSLVEVGAGAGGVAAGMLLAVFMPFPDTPGKRTRLFRLFGDARLMPTVVDDGGGLALAGRFSL